jgi:hypothetical protein
MSELNIHQKMAKITTELETVAKNLSVGAGRSSYKAVGEADILAAVKPLEEKYGIYSYPMDREVIHQDTKQWVEDVIDKYNFKDDKGEALPTIIQKQKTLHIIRLKTTYRFVDIDNPSDFIDQVSIADGLDPADKGSGKAMTYADKYALMKAYKIMTGDDPDQNHSESYANNSYKKKEKKEFVQITTRMIDDILELIGDDFSRTQKVLAHYGVDAFEKLDVIKGVDCVNMLKKGNANK